MDTSSDVFESGIWLPYGFRYFSWGGQVECVGLGVGVSEAGSGWYLCRVLRGVVIFLSDADSPDLVRPFR